MYCNISKVIFIILIVPSPIVTIDSSLVFGELGMSAILECNVTLPDDYDMEKYPDTSYYIEWIYNGATVSMSNTPISTDSVVSQYIVNTVSQSTVGNYMCQVSIIYTGDQTQYVNNSNKVSGMIILETSSKCVVFMYVCTCIQYILTYYLCIKYYSVSSSSVMTSSRSVPSSVSSQPIDSGVVAAAVLGKYI